MPLVLALIHYTSIIKKSYVPPTSQVSDITTKIKEYFMKYYNEKKKLKCITF